MVNAKLCICRSFGAMVSDIAATENCIGDTNPSPYTGITKTESSASLEYAGLNRMVKNVMQVEKVLGDGIKRIYDSEIPAMKKLRENI